MGKARPWWLLQFLVGAVGLGLGLEWLGKKADLVAPWWAWSAMLLSLLIVWALIQVGERVDFHAGGHGATRQTLEGLYQRIVGLEKTLADIREWQEQEPIREQERQKVRAWEAKHKDELAVLRIDSKSEDQEIATKALLRWLELNRELRGEASSDKSPVGEGGPKKSQ
jgi:hypothetical protein